MRSRVFIKRVLKISITVLLFWSIINILNYIYVEGDPWYRILWHHYYEDDGRIENLYLGSSHVFYSIVPEIMDQKNGLYNFNLATPNQRLNSSYYLLREADQNNELSAVYLEVFFEQLTEDNFNGNKDPVRDELHYDTGWQNTDYMKMSLNKLAYMFSIGDSQYWLDIMLPFVRYREKLGDKDYIRRVLSNKAGEYYRTYTYWYEFEDGNGYVEMLGQGYFFSSRELLDENMIREQSRILRENPIGEISEKYLRRIISYCQQRDIPITLFEAPMHESVLIGTEQYDNYVEQIKEIAAEYGIDFYDFNLAREEYLPIGQNKNFYDLTHLNHEGACLFTSLFYDVVSCKSDDEKEKYFYSSYEEKLQNQEPEVYGLYYRDSEITADQPEASRVYHIASNREEGMEYKICVITEDGVEFIVQDFGTNKIFERPAEERGTCTIEARMEGETKILQTLILTY